MKTVIDSMFLEPNSAGCCVSKLKTPLPWAVDNRAMYCSSFGVNLLPGQWGVCEYTALAMISLVASVMIWCLKTCFRLPGDLPAFRDKSTQMIQVTSDHLETNGSSFAHSRGNRRPLRSYCSFNLKAGLKLKAATIVLPGLSTSWSQRCSVG